MLTEFTEAYWDPAKLHREEPRNQGGPRKPRCVRCGSERFTPVAWECGGCGVTYDALPFPPETGEEGGGPGGHQVDGPCGPQWGGTLTRKWLASRGGW